MKPVRKDRFNDMKREQQSIENLKHIKPEPGFPSMEVEANFHISGSLEAPQSMEQSPSNSVKQRHVPINQLWTKCLCPSQNLHVGILIPNVMIVGGETWEVNSHEGEALRDYCLHKRDPSFNHGRMQEKLTISNPKEDPHQNSTVLASLSQASSLQNSEK